MFSFFSKNKKNLDIESGHHAENTGLLFNQNNNERDETIIPLLDDQQDQKDNMDVFSGLSNELMVKIFSYCNDLKTLSQLSFVNHRMNAIVDEIKTNYDARIKENERVQIKGTYADIRIAMKNLYMLNKEKDKATKKINKIESERDGWKDHCMVAAALICVFGSGTVPACMIIFLLEETCGIWGALGIGLAAGGSIALSSLSGVLYGVSKWDARDEKVVKHHDEVEKEIQEIRNHIGLI